MKSILLYIYQNTYKWILFIKVPSRLMSDKQWNLYTFLSNEYVKVLNQKGHVFLIAFKQQIFGGLTF